MVISYNPNGYNPNGYDRDLDARSCKYVLFPDNEYPNGGVITTEKLKRRMPRRREPPDAVWEGPEPKTPVQERALKHIFGAGPQGRDCTAMEERTFTKALAPVYTYLPYYI